MKITAMNGNIRKGIWKPLSRICFLTHHQKTYLFKSLFRRFALQSSVPFQASKYVTQLRRSLSKASWRRFVGFLKKIKILKKIFCSKKNTNVARACRVLLWVLAVCAVFFVFFSLFCPKWLAMASLLRRCRLNQVLFALGSLCV